MKMSNSGACVSLCVSVRVHVYVLVNATYAGQEHEFHLHNKTISVHSGLFFCLSIWIRSVFYGSGQHLVKVNVNVRHFVFMRSWGMC